MFSLTAESFYSCLSMPFAKNNRVIAIEQYEGTGMAYIEENSWEARCHYCLSR